MIILNTCIDCGRVPSVGSNEYCTHYVVCVCGKEVFSETKVWSAEVAADMWNRANPVEQGFEFNRGYINFLAGELARYKLHVIIIGGVLTVRETCPNDLDTADEIDKLLRECRLHKQDLAEFYRKRLDPVR